MEIIMYQGEMDHYMPIVQDKFEFLKKQNKGRIYISGII